MTGLPVRAMLAARIALAAAIMPPAPGHVLVVTESGVPAFADAVAGVTASLGPAARVVDIGTPRGSLDLTEALQSRDTHMVVAIGNRAVSEVGASIFGAKGTVWTSARFGANVTRALAAGSSA